MKKQRIKAVALTTVISASALIGNSALADKTLDAVLQVSQSKIAAGVASQRRVDKLQDETRDLFSKFKVVNKEIDGLRVYNKQLEKQLESQRRVLQDLEESIDQVTVIERQIQPLILRMLDGLEQFVSLDMPFRVEEREKRINDLRANQDRADITVSEKFRQVLEAYSIEAEYGRKLDTDTATLNVGGQDREVNILAVGRVALIYQTLDTRVSGAWDKKEKTWVELNSADYRAPILKAIRIAKKQASIDVMELPISAPEAAK